MALNIAIDANRYTDLFKGVPQAVHVLSTASRVFLPFVVVGELRGGFRKGSRTEENERHLAAFLRKPDVEILFANDATTHLYADIYANLSRAGTPIPPNDMWIAALVLQHDLVLFSRDRHFDRVPRIPRI